VAFYASSDDLYGVAGRLFEQIQADPQATADLTRSRMGIRFRCTEPDAEFFIDGRRNPAVVKLGPTTERADLEVGMAADLLHAVWLGRVRVRDAFASGRIQVGGNIFRALMLAELFRRAETLYPQVLEEMGRPY